MSGKAIRNTKPIHDLKRATKISVVIPSAGEGIRMRTIGPRSLIKIDGRTLIEHQANIIRDTFPHAEIVLVCGYEADYLMDRVPRGTICVENEHYPDTNVLRSIGMGLRATTHDNVLIVYGDLVFNPQSLDFPIEKSCITYKTDESTATEPEVGCTIDGTKLENIFYGLSNRWSSIAFFKGKELSLLKEISYNRNKAKLYGWEAINWIMESGGEFDAYCPKGSHWFDIDSSKDIPA